MFLFHPMHRLSIEAVAKVATRQPIASVVRIVVDNAQAVNAPMTCTEGIHLEPWEVATTIASTRRMFFIRLHPLRNLCRKRHSRQLHERPR